MRWEQAVKEGKRSPGIVTWEQGRGGEGQLIPCLNRAPLASTTPTAPPWRQPVGSLCYLKGDTWDGANFPAWCIANVAQSTPFFPFSCSINWFIIFHVHCAGLNLDMVQDAGSPVSEHKREP